MASIRFQDSMKVHTKFHENRSTDLKDQTEDAHSHRCAHMGAHMHIHSTVFS
jgi:hypothetical protein